ncbi:MAG: hypothetical protein WCJ30_04480 [Deltaproteobacteria bacterium]
MNNPQRLAMLETLLARVTERRSQPRPARLVPVVAPPAAAIHAAPPATASAHVAPASLPPAERVPSALPPAPRPPTLAPVAAQVTQPTPPRTPAPPAFIAPETEQPATSRASRPPPRLAVDELPDLDLVETEAFSGQMTASLVPSSTPLPDAMETEFEIPSHAPPPRIVPPQALELSPESDEEPIEIDRAPLATATIPPPGRASVHELDLESVAGSIAGAASAAAAALGLELETSREETAPAPRRYAGPAVPAATIARVVPLVQARPRTFRELLERSLDLRPRR